MFEFPSYIVLNVPSPAAEMVRNLRRRFDPVRSELAVEISLTGSCGLGSIAPGQDAAAVFTELDRIAAEVQPFDASFVRICRFIGTGIYYLTLADHDEFDKLHQMLQFSKIHFLSNPWTYEPHCTLKLRGPMTEDDEARLLEIELPPNRFTLNTMSVYELRSAYDPQLLHRCNLGV